MTISEKDEGMCPLSESYQYDDSDLDVIQALGADYNDQSRNWKYQKKKKIVLPVSEVKKNC